MSCLTAGKHNMYADVEEYVYDHDSDASTADMPAVDQDPISGAIITSGNGEGGTGQWRVVKSRVPMLVRGIITQGISALGTTEQISDIYKVVDYVRIFTKYPLKRNQRITRISNKQGEVIWIEEEQADLVPTTFNIMGMTPIVGPFGELIEYTGLGERAEVQV